MAPCIEGLTAARIRAALARAAASAPFHASPALVAFLTFVVEETIAGRGGALKAYTVATLALGRGAGFNPQHDAIVRTEAARLRRALAAYYAGPGAGEAVRIALPVGCYRPRFVAGDGGAHPEADAPGPAPVESVPASTYLTYVATFFLDERALGWPRGRPGDGLADAARPYDAAA